MRLLRFIIWSENKVMTSGDKEISKKASMDGAVKGCLESLRNFKVLNCIWLE